jgi:hypothetical protein
MSQCRSGQAKRLQRSAFTGCARWCGRRWTWSSTRWLKYTAKKQGLDVADLATRRPENRAINAAMRQASAVFAPKLRPAYKAEGVILRDDATSIQWLPEMHLERAPAKTAELDEAWRDLRETDLPMWLAVGLARFAGLRRKEIEHATRAWIEGAESATYVVLKDRPDENWRTKTGRPYRALVLDADLAAALQAAPENKPLVNPATERRAHWFERELQLWLRPFVGDAKKPLHRLRGLYADQLSKLTEDAVAAKLAGRQEAARNLGHTSTKTAEKHYLSDA